MECSRALRDMTARTVVSLGTALCSRWLAASILCIFNITRQCKTVHIRLSVGGVLLCDSAGQLHSALAVFFWLDRSIMCGTVFSIAIISTC